jgi:phage baseplate assembly protein W
VAASPPAPALAEPPHLSPGYAPAQQANSFDGAPADPDDGSFVGSSVSWPLEVDHAGSITSTDGVEDLDQSIQMVLLTVPGERLGRPDFGCRIWDLLFEPVTADLLDLVAQAVRESLARWEPRIAVDDVKPAVDSDDPALIRIAISYRVRETNDRRYLVYPFYVMPHEPEA